MTYKYFPKMPFTRFECTKILLMLSCLFTITTATMMSIDQGHGEMHHDDHPIPQRVVLPEEVTENYKTYNVSLDYDGEIILTWWLDYKSRIVTMRVDFDPDVPDFDWFAIGFSNRGEMEFADYCILKLNDKNAYMKDVNADEFGFIKNDATNDCLNVQWNGAMRTLQYSRYFDTCDDEDYIIEEGTTHIVWARGTSVQMEPMNAGSKEHGMVRVQLLKNEKEPDIMPASTKIFDVTVKNVKVPSSDTTYYCKTYKMPDWMLEKKHHIIQFEALITKGNEGLVHHMEVYYCDAPIEHYVDEYEGSCFDKSRPNSTQVCYKVRSAWAMGAAPFPYPKQAGLSIGGPDANPFLMLEVHYNNPQMYSKWIDSSGIRMYVTPDLRKYEASIMEFGLEYIDKMVIPPGQERFQLSGYCTADCTNIGLPDGGIIIFGSQLHTHLTGITVQTRHFRNGIELPMLNEDNHFSSHFQEIRILKQPVRVLPGDSLITTCTFNTKSRENVTFGGHSIQDEMCVNYVHYYPASNLEVCKSSVSTKAMQDFFKFENYWEGMATAADKNVRENYNSIMPWNRLRVKALASLFYEQPISMQCNASNGNRFPGSWDNNERDPILLTLPLPKRQCPDYGNEL